ncbi:MAG: hypothetical protein ABEH78_03535 [Haloferacaceae archaeon]
MGRQLIAVILVALLVVGVGAVVTGFGPAPGGASGSDVESFPTETATPSGGAGATTATGTATPRPAFAFTIDRIEECGQTCRDVTSTLRNEGDARATAVVVYTRVFAGNGTDGDVVWSGKERVGELPAGESHTATRRVELSYSEGLAVKNADGWITIQTTVESDQRTVTFTQRRDVS